MYGHEYRRRGFRFGCVPVVLGILLLTLLFTGGFHHLWFVVGPLMFGIPFFIAGAITTLVVLRWRNSGPHQEPFGDFFRGEKAKRHTQDAESDTFYA